MRTDLKITYADYATLPETNRRQELLDGDLIVSPSPLIRHQLIVQRIGVAMMLHVEARKLGMVIMTVSDVVLSEVDVVQPDVYFVSNGRRKIIVKEGLRGAPDLCVEVFSKSSKKTDLGYKRALYARHGVVEYWTVDPVANTVDIFRLQENATESVRKLQSSDVLTTTLLPGLKLQLSEIFAE